MPKDIQTPWTDYPVMVPDPAGDGIARRGGEDLGEGSAKETANQSGLPPLPDRYSVPDMPAEGSTHESSVTTHQPIVK